MFYYKYSGGFNLKISSVSYVSNNRRRYRKSKVSSYFSILLLLILVIILILSARGGWNLSHPTKLLPQTIGIKEPSNIMTEITFSDSQNKINLKGSFYKASSPDNCLILSHDYGKNRLIFDSATLPFIKSCLEKNYNVLTFDYRNSGNSDKDVSTFGFYEKYDLLGAVKYAKSNGAQHISILGLSAGASTSLLTVADDPGMVESIIVDSSFIDLKQYLYYNLPTWNNLPSFPFTLTTISTFSLFTGVDVGDVSPLLAIKKIPAEKIMIIHSENDNIYPL